jgi:hypothetical protein
MRTSGNEEFALLTACCLPSKHANLTSLLTSRLDWERVIESAEHHRLFPALHSALAGMGGIPSTLRVRAHKHAWRAMRFTTELAKIARHFDQRGVEFLALKGPALSQVLYENPCLRQFGDLDLLVRAQDMARARTALNELGFESGLHLSPKQEKSHLHSGYECVFDLKSEPHVVELQWQVVPRFYSIDFDIDQLFNRSLQIDIDGARLQTLGHNDLMLVLCVHAAKHEWSQLGMLRDIAALMSFNLDWGWIAGEASRLGILKILQISLLAAREVFSLTLPALLPSPIAGSAETASAVVSRLQHDYEPDTESVHYFHDQLRARERLRDRAQFVWHLATTPGVEEWKALRIPDRYFAAYRGVRIGRLIKRFLF